MITINALSNLRAAVQSVRAMPEHAHLPFAIFTNDVMLDGRIRREIEALGGLFECPLADYASHIALVRRLVGPALPAADLLSGVRAAR